MFSTKPRCRARSAEHGRCVFRRGHAGTHRDATGLAFGPYGDLPVPCWDGDARYESLEDLVDAWVRRAQRPTAPR